MSELQNDDPGGFLTRWSRRKVQLRQGVVLVEPPWPVAQPTAPPIAPSAATLLQREGAVTPPLPAAAAGPTTLRAVPAGQVAPGLAPSPAQPQPPSVIVEVPPPPTLADVAALGRDSDFSRFVAPGVDSGVRNAALQKLFTDPHFNIMDGLDTYIDDYGKPDPLPAHWLRKMVQSQSLGLFDDEKAEAEPATTAAVSALPAAALPPAATATRSDAAAASGRIPDNPISQDSNTHEDADLRLQPDYAAGPASPGASAEPDTGGQR